MVMDSLDKALNGGGGSNGGGGPGPSVISTGGIPGDVVASVVTTGGSVGMHTLPAAAVVASPNVVTNPPNGIGGVHAPNAQQKTNNVVIGPGGVGGMPPSAPIAVQHPQNPSASSSKYLISSRRLTKKDLLLHLFGFLDHFNHTKLN